MISSTVNTLEDLFNVSLDYNEEDLYKDYKDPLPKARLISIPMVHRSLPITTLNTRYSTFDTLCAEDYYHDIPLRSTGASFPMFSLMPLIILSSSNAFWCVIGWIGLWIRVCLYSWCLAGVLSLLPRSQRPNVLF